MTVVMLSTCVVLQVAESYDEVVASARDREIELDEFHDFDGNALAIDTRHIVAVSGSVATLKPVYIPPTQEDVDAVMEGRTTAKEPEPADG